MAGQSIATVQDEVRDLIETKGLTLIGFAIGTDIEVLGLQDFPPERVIDIQPHFDPMQGICLPQLEPGHKFGLKKLATIVLGRSIQEGSHKSLEYARATMVLFKWGRERVLKAHVRC